MMRLTRLNELIEDGEKQKGYWELSPGHELWYRREKLNEEIRLKGALLAAEEDALLFSVTEKQADQKIVTSLLKLSGKWRANAKNQLVFEAQRESGKTDTLTFTSGWKVNDNQEIVYTFFREDLKTKTKKTSELVFSGFWDVSEENTLTYLLGADSASAFRFRGTFGSKSILAKTGRIRFQLGAEVSGKAQFRTLSLFGKWKLSRSLALSFEMEYKNSNRAILFGAEYAFGDSGHIEASVKTQNGGPAGFELLLTKDFFKGNAQGFMRLQRLIEESRAEAGVRVRW